MIPPVANRFVAGEDSEDALDRAATLADEDVTAIINRLGEHYDRAEPALEDTEAYIGLIDAIRERKFDASISVKPSQLGVEVDERLFESNLERILRAARGDVFVWLDMEDHQTTDATVEAYERFVDDHPEMGVCLQANLRRTPSDLSRLANTPGKIRLVKGAYDESAAIAHIDGEDIDEAYRQLVEAGIADTEARIAVASHDDEMISHADMVATKHNASFDVQMLMGVREGYQRELTTEHEVYQYVPYGDAWLSYFYRRIRERTDNLEFAARAIFEQYS